MVRYPVHLEPDDNGTILVSFPDFPEAHTFGDDRDDALARAKDALATVVDGYIRARRPLPTPSAIGRQGEVAELSALMSAKVEIFNLMTAAGVTKSELGRRLDCHPPQVDRLLDLRHQSRVDQLDTAIRALGGQLMITVCLPSVPSSSRTLLAALRAKTTRRRTVAHASGAARARVHPGVLVTAATTRRSGASKKK